MTRPGGAAGGTLAVAIAACLFGTLGPVSRAAYDGGLTPLAFSLWRAVVGAAALALLLAFLHARGRDRVHWRTLPPRAVVALGLTGATSLVLNLAIFSAFGRTSIALALLGFYTYPALVAGAAVLLGEERLTRTRAAALALALAGMAVVVLGGGAGGSVDAGGFGLALLAAAMQAVYVLLGRRGFRAIPSEEATFGVVATTAAGFLVLVVASGASRVATLPLREPAILPPLLWAGIAGAAVPTLLFLLAIRSIGPTRTSIVALVEPVAGTLLAAALLGEALGPAQLAGGALVLLAATLLQRGGEDAEPHEQVSGTT
ncbi:MAG: DMT family transporter [Chloroflexi bacterium]|nr:DMT family transporter [Chloroflexota bacterium]MDA8236265.1 DMT family transporter [Chloroflexota bacterium]